MVTGARVGCLKMPDMPLLPLIGCGLPTLTLTNCIFTPPLLTKRGSASPPRIQGGEKNNTVSERLFENFCQFVVRQHNWVALHAAGMGSFFDNRWKILGFDSVSAQRRNLKLSHKFLN